MSVRDYRIAYITSQRPLDGVGRYSGALGDALRDLGVELQEDHPDLAGPAPIGRMLSWVGRDADAYFNNYALRARMPPGGHLPPDQPVPGTAAGDGSAARRW